MYNISIFKCKNIKYSCLKKSSAFYSHQKNVPWKKVTGFRGSSVFVKATTELSNPSLALLHSSKCLAGKRESSSTY